MKVIRKEFIEECEDDFVCLWSPVKSIRLAHPEWSDEDVKIETLFMLGELLDSDTIVAVNRCNVNSERIPIPNVEWAMDWLFKALVSSPPEIMIPLRDDNHTIIKKIAEKWDALGRDPDMYEIVWFTSADYECPIDTEGLERDEWPV